MHHHGGLCVRLRHCRFWRRVSRVLVRGFGRQKPSEATPRATELLCIYAKASCHCAPAQSRIRCRAAGLALLAWHGQSKRPRSSAWSARPRRAAGLRATPRSRTALAPSGGAPLAARHPTSHCAVGCTACSCPAARGAPLVLAAAAHNLSDAGRCHRQDGRRGRGGARARSGGQAASASPAVTAPAAARPAPGASARGARPPP